MLHVRGKTSLIVVSLVIAAGASGVAAVAAGTSGLSAANRLAPDNPTVMACVSRRGQDCNPNPAVRATFVAGNPIAQQPNAHPTYISEQAAISRARGAADAASPTSARLMTRAGLQALDPNLAENGIANPDRKIWVVTVHGNTLTMGDPEHKPRLVHVYTVVVDAESGIVTDSCVGCATLP